MPQYRFVTKSAEADLRAEEFGMYNDEGALQFARRFVQNRAVEVWEQERLVGRVEPVRTLVRA